MSQTVTPELRRWIIEQASAGCTPEFVLKSMLDAGWDASVAEGALERTLLEHLSTVSPDALSQAAPEVREAVQGALVRLSGQPEKPSVAAWREWWAARAR